jgi:hypothetical protein
LIGHCAQTPPHASSFAAQVPSQVVPEQTFPAAQVTHAPPQFV